MADQQSSRPDVVRTEAEWRQVLTPDQYRVLRQHGTEPAGAHPYNDEHRDGVFACAGCGAPLFDSSAKYDSGSGWPSFSAPVGETLGTSLDRSHFMVREEIHCRRCGGHVGHVFDDGPRPTGRRYCTNGTALKFEPR